MPKVCVYLPDRLHSEARRLDLSLSALIQDAVERAVAGDALNRWLGAQQLRTLRSTALPAPAPGDAAGQAARDDEGDATGDEDGWGA
ncbi:hypothetical protein [Jannaschia sp. R86511]|uniref:hypothetical protein n=1 Tax=Jannaschia sp. R86511 TaxID=3093853 RepID=UPI0036D2F197